jgi:hypothetical protein
LAPHRQNALRGLSGSQQTKHVTSSLGGPLAKLAELEEEMEEGLSGEGAGGLLRSFRAGELERDELAEPSLDDAGVGASDSLGDGGALLPNLIE